MVMATTKEGAVKKEINKVLTELGVYYFMPSGNGYGRSAIPDFVCCLPNGKFLGIEAKADDKQPTAIQQRELDKIAMTGGLGICVNAENVVGLKTLITGFSQ